MTHFEYDLAVRAVIGFAGCAVALVVVVADWLDARRHGYVTGWRVTSTFPLEQSNTRGDR